MQPIIIGSCSTIPSRVNKMRDTLLSIKNQSLAPTHIELNLPLLCKRTKEPYPEPEWSADPELKDFVKIYRTDDMGPITKLYPTIERNQSISDISSNVFIFSFDDDIHYHPETIQVLYTNYREKTKPTQLKKQNATNVAVGISGFNFTSLFNMINIAPQYTINPVQILEGYGGVLYPLTSFKPDFKVYINLTQQSEDAFFSDDVIISNYLERQKVLRYVAVSEVYNRLKFWEDKTKTILDYGLEQDALQAQTGGHNKRYERLFKDKIVSKVMKLKPQIIL